MKVSEKKKAYMRQWHKEHKEQQKEYMRNWRSGHKETVKTYISKYREENKDHLKKVVTENHKRNRDRINEVARNTRERQRKIALDHYGGMCVCCGETHYDFLAFDHIHNDGAKHRREIKSSRMVSWLIKEGFPEGRIQILCHNCNMAKAYRGECPHIKMGVRR